MAKVEDGKVYIPIPISLFESGAVNLQLPITVASLDVGGILIYNTNFVNPDNVKSLIKPL